MMKLTIFAWQPVPSYRYDLTSHIFHDEARETLGERDNLRSGYALLSQKRLTDPRLKSADDFLWLADLQEGRHEALYVDVAHYTASFSSEIAGQLAAAVGRQLGCPTAQETERG